MADEPIIIEVDDKVDPAVQEKLEGIRDSAREGYDALKDLKDQLSSIDTSGLAGLQTAATNVGNSLKDQLEALQQLLKARNSIPPAPPIPVPPVSPINDFTNATYQAANAENKFINSVRDSANTFGKSRSEVLAYRAGLLGVTNQARPFIDTLAQAESKLVGVERSGHNATRELIIMGRELSEGNVARFSGSLTTLIARTGLWRALLNPVTAGVVALTGAIVGGVVVQQQYAAMQNSTNVVLQSFGRGLGLTRDQFNDMAEAAGAAANLTTRQSVGLAQDLARTGQLSAENISKIISLSSNFATSVGEDFDTARKDLVKIFSDPQKGIEELNSKLHFLDATTADYVRKLFEQGQGQDALNIAIDKMAPALANARENMTTTEKLWDWVTRRISQGASNTGKALDANIGNGKIQEQINDATKIILELQQTRFTTPDTTAIDAEIAKQSANIERLEAMRQKLQSGAKSKADEADLNKKSVELQKFVEQADPAGTELKKLVEDFDRLNKVLDNPALAKTVGLTEQFKRALENTKVAQDGYIDAASRTRAVSALDVEAIGALSAAQRADIATRRTRAELQGKNMDDGLREAQIATAGATILAQSVKQRADENYELTRRIGLFGIYGRQRELELELLQRELAARQSGNAYSAPELAALRQKLTLNQNLAGVQDQLDALYNRLLKPQKDYNDLLVAANRLYQDGRINADTYFRTIADAQIKVLEAENTMISGIKAGLLQIQSDAANVAGIMKTGIVDAANAGQNAFVTFAQTGKFSMSQLATDVVGSLAKIVYQLTIVRTIMAALGWLGINVSPTSSQSTNPTNLDTFTSGVGATSNSIVSTASSRESLKRSLSPSIVPSQHAQVQALQTAALSPAQHARSGPLVEVKVENHAPDKVRVDRKTQRGMDGKEVHRMIISSVNEGIAAGEFDRNNGGRFGVAVPMKVKG